MPHAFTPAWLADAPAATALLPRSYASAEGRRAAVEAAASRTVHPAVLRTLTATSPAQRENLEALSRPGTTAVVTGQQAGLFGGPLYTVYKAAAAIVNARALAAESGRPCVPVFWLQNEDHDFDEIARATVLAQDGSLVRPAVQPDGGSPDRSVRCQHLGPDLALALDTVAEALGGLSAADEVLALLRTHWTPGTTPDAAFRGWIEALFAEHGLLLLDPSHPELRAAAAPVHARALAEHGAIATTLLARSRALSDAGFAVQVHVRPDSPLCFVHPGGPDGPRHRTSVSDPATLHSLPDPLAQPGCYSTSALLRPILQDSWLPTAAIVCGPGEVAYFAQLPPLYAHFGIPMPAIVPRARFLVLDATSLRLLDQLALTPADLSDPPDTLRARVAPTGDHPAPDALLAELTDPVHRALTALDPHAAALDPGLSRAVHKTRDHMRQTAEKLVDRYRRALTASDSITTDRLDRLLARLQPDGAPQERVHSWPSYGARYGIGAFVAAVIAHTRPFHGTLEELRP